MCRIIYIMIQLWYLEDNELWVRNSGCNFCCKYFHCKIILVKLKHDLWKLLIFADRSENETIDFFFKYWTVSYLQFGYFFVKYAYCTWIELQTRVILDTLHRGEPPFEGNKLIATTSSTKKEWLAILDYTQYTWATDVIIISLFSQKDYYTYQINWMELSARTKSIDVIMAISEIE